MRHPILTLLLGAIAAFACTPEPTFPDTVDREANGEPEQPVTPGQAVSFTVIDEVHNTIISGVLDRRRTVIRSESEWLAFWDEFTAAVEPKPEPPAIDFGERMVLVAAMGQRSTGGYAIEIVEVTERDGGLAARVKETVPGASCLLVQVITSPVTAVSVPRRVGSVEFTEVTETLSC